ncbi:hypothetical protein HYDPIDRAFT_170861 [Hydnomerulius pinastri MD-312]|uniref:F-box domain-containing protein n=1 Tax=Hydnomerulius pinastri MD-312 TaxID=994086 RepID=A0A0C9V254_9AGAM|nr:hypothetical protein HYDPIDRAFT_170861 [Hydnomerulius pinastri MD-312]
MHEAWLVADVFVEILNHITYNHSQPTLASLAVTCRAFREPALDKLWRALRSICPILHLLHETLRRECGNSGGLSEAEITRVQSAMLKYTSRVHSIRLAPVSNFRPPYLSNIPTLFPMLRELDWIIGGLPTSTAQPLLGQVISTLRKLRLWGSEDLIPSDMSFISSLPDLCPDITVLEISCTWGPAWGNGMDVDPSGAVSDAFSSAIERWQNLSEVSLNIPNLEPRTLQHLAGLPSLRVLDLHVPPHSSLNEAFPDLRPRPKPLGLERPLPPPFSGLQRLAMYGGMDEFPYGMHAFINVDVFLNHLRKLKFSPRCVNLLVKFEEADLPAILEVTASSTNLSELQEFCLRPWYRREEPRAGFDKIRSMLGWYNLTKVKLGISIAMNDSELGEIAMAWPLLEELHFAAKPAESPLLPTWIGFVDLIRRCRKLESVGLPVDTTLGAETILEEIDNEGRCKDQELMNSHLDFINFLGSKIHDADMVARILRALFPMLNWRDSSIFTRSQVPFRHLKRFIFPHLSGHDAAALVVVTLLVSGDLSVCIAPIGDEIGRHYRKALTDWLCLFQATKLAFGIKHP